MTPLGLTPGEPPQLLANAAWLVEVDGHPVSLELTFRDGETYEAGMHVGPYECVGASFIASIGEEARLVVDTGSMASGALAARMLTKRDGALIDEPAVLYRVVWN
jgi:hypothetical protein